MNKEFFQLAIPLTKTKQTPHTNETNVKYKIFDSFFDIQVIESYRVRVPLKKPYTVAPRRQKQWNKFS